MKSISFFKYLLIIPIFLLLGLFLSVQQAKAYGECSEYGLMVTYDSYSHTCKCMSGYVFGTGVLGKPYCVSADQVCKDKYGYNAQSDYSGASCKCGYGYSFGKDSIVELNAFRRTTNATINLVIIPATTV